MAAIVIGLFSVWEAGLLFPWIPPLARSDSAAAGWWYTTLLGLLLSLNAGLILWQQQEGRCPVGVRRASGLAGVLGAFTLLCPVCIVLPASVFGLGAVFALAAPFLPLLRLIAMLLLAIALWLLWPRSPRSA